MTNHDPRDRDLEQFARPAKAEILEPGGMPTATPRGHALVRPTTGIADRIVGAQEVAHRRNEAVIRQQLTELAAWAGDDWFYRFPVQKQGGGQDWIEGPTIKLANNVARIFGNNETMVRAIDVGDAWEFYARWTDIETGFSMERAFRQRKAQVSLKTKDSGRAQDIAYQIGQSKAIRNVIVNSLGHVCDFAFEEARNSLVNKISKNLEGSRKRALERIEGLAVDLLRVERVLGRAAKNWLAPDIARVVAMIQSIEDGMASSDETFPRIESSVTAPSDKPRGAAPEPGDGGEQTAPEDEARAKASAAEASHSSDAAKAPAAADGSDPEHAAYAAGIKAKAEGARRSALPGEFRTAERDHEAQAWLRGHDGKPF